MTKHFIECSETIVLDCRCGDKLVLFGEEDDWRSRNAIFQCHCGEKLTLDDRISEKALRIKELVRNEAVNS